MREKIKMNDSGGNDDRSELVCAPKVKVKRGAALTPCKPLVSRKLFTTAARLTLKHSW